MEDLNQRVREEKMRELAHIGDLQAIRDIVSKETVDINSHNSVNGMTALHWAVVRNHSPVVNYLLSQGADKYAVSKDGHTPVHLASSDDVRISLQRDGCDTTMVAQYMKPALPIIPNYISNPLAYPVGDFPTPSSTNSSQSNINHYNTNNNTTEPGAAGNSFTTDFSVLEEEELVLKIRVATRDTDFIEVELNQKNLSFCSLISLCCQQLEVDQEKLLKIRKLPNTILRKDKDVRRLTDFQELELILKPSKFSAIPTVDGHDTLKQQIPQSFWY